jgi:hypothetical protein
MRALMLARGSVAMAQRTSSSSHLSEMPMCISDLLVLSEGLARLQRSQEYNTFGWVSGLGTASRAGREQISFPGTQVPYPS